MKSLKTIKKLIIVSLESRDETKKILSIYSPFSSLPIKRKVFLSTKACKAAKEAVWLNKFLSDFGIVRIEQISITLFCDNSGAVVQSKDPRNYKKGKYIERKYIERKYYII